MKPSGIGGQAVIEGIMMRNKDKYSIAVRKPDNEIEVTVRESKVLTEKHKWMSYPVIRGVVSFIDSLITGISTINYSASFYDDPDEQKKTKADEIGNQISEQTENEVFCAEFPISQNSFFAAAQADIQAEKGLIVQCLDYADERLVIYNNIKYTVYRRYARPDGLVELYLTGGRSNGGN